MRASDIEDVYELSPLQHGMLFENLYAPAEGTYIEQSVLTIGGVLDHAAFWNAWQLVVDRHPALRTTFHWDDIKKPVQTVHRTVPLPRTEEDWRGRTEHEQQEMLEKSLREQRIQGFDLVARPPMHIRLCLLTDELSHLVLCFHHLILDGWSVGIILSEFMAAYQAFYHDRDADLPAAGRYRDYVAWWRRGRGAEVQRYWRDHLADYPPPPPLELGTPQTVAPEDPPYAWEQSELGDLAADIRAFSRAHRITPHTLIQGAWTAVLSRCLSAEDLTVGTTFAHRPAELPHGESIVGCMVATVPVRTSVASDRRVLDYLHDIQQAIMSARDTAVADLVEIHEWSDIARSARLFESIVTYQNIPLPTLSFAEEGIELRGYTVDTRPQLPLVLMVLPGAELPLRLVHDRRRFGVGQAGLLLARVRSTLRALLRDPEGCVGDLDVRPERERRIIEHAGRDRQTVETIAASGTDLAHRLRGVVEPVEIRLLDERFIGVPLGAVGEICVAGPGAAGLDAAGLDQGAELVADPTGAAWGGLVHRSGLRARYDERGGLELLGGPVADPAAAPEPATGGAPRTETEKALAELMADILNLPEPGVHDNLVEFGLHSLLGTRAINRIRELWTVSIPLRTVFERPTVAELAGVIEAGGEPEQARANRRRVDLPAEVTLDASVRAPGPPARHGSPDHILLTGATGYLGPFLLERLLRDTTARVTCLVRAAEPDDGLRRVRDALRAAGLWRDAFADRIGVLPGNLAQPGLGLTADDFALLAAKVDEIYHAGAAVNILPAYRRIKPTNVDGTRDILRLAATTRTKPVHYISPAELTEHPDPEKNGREVPLDPVPPETHNGYIESKWVADRLMTLADQRGVPTVVYRAARLVGSAEPAYWKPGDATSEIVQACVHLGLVPDAEITLPASPVDYVAAAMAALSRRPESFGHQYHLVSPQPFSFRVLADALVRAGYRTRLVDLDAWFAELVRLSARLADRRWDLVLAVVGPWKQAARAGQHEPDYDTSRARAALGTAVTCPPVDADYLAAGVDHFAAAGLVPPPADPARRG